MKRPKNREPFGDAGVIKKALDEGRCPKCLTNLPEPADDGSVTCSVCLLTIGDYRDMSKMQIKE